MLYQLSHFRPNVPTARWCRAARAARSARPTRSGSRCPTPGCGTRTCCVSRPCTRRADARGHPGRLCYAGTRCGRGSVGRASPCQGEGRGFESRRPLSEVGCPCGMAPCGGVAEWLRQGPAKPCTRVRFPSPPPRFPDTERHGPMQAVPLRRLYRSGIAGDVHGCGVGSPWSLWPCPVPDSNDYAQGPNGVDATSTSCERHGWDIHAV